MPWDPGQPSTAGPTSPLAGRWNADTKLRPRKADGRRLDVPMCIRVNGAERKQWIDAATSAGISLPAWIRRTCRAAVRRPTRTSQAREDAQAAKRMQAQRDRRRQ